MVNWLEVVLGFLDQSRDLASRQCERAIAELEKTVQLTGVETNRTSGHEGTHRAKASCFPRNCVSRQSATAEHLDGWEWAAAAKKMLKLGTGAANRDRQIILLSNAKPDSARPASPPAPPANHGHPYIYLRNSIDAP
jgi:hypothetical protein